METEKKTVQVEPLLLSCLAQRELAGLMRQYITPYKELMAYYRCAMMEVSSKFNVLNEEFSLQYDRNPIENVRTRLKTPESIAKKLQMRGFPLTVDSIEKHLNDVAGVRVICSYSSDIYMLAEALTRQDDVTLLNTKDYIKSPKPNGYRSLHLIIETPIFLHTEKRLMKVEVQLRTISMDLWASLEHKIRYKRDLPNSAETDKALLECAMMSAEVENRMEQIQKVSDRYPRNDTEKLELHTVLERILADSDLQKSVDFS